MAALGEMPATIVPGRTGQTGHRTYPYADLPDLLEPAKQALLKHGVLSKDTHGTVARFAPPLIVDREQLDWGVARIRDALAEYGPVYEKAA